MEVRSAGLSSSSRRKVNLNDIKWADLVFVMEAEQKIRLREKFRCEHLPKIECLDIPDEYEFMNEELIELLRMGIDAHIKG